MPSPVRGRESLDPGTSPLDLALAIPFIMDVSAREGPDGAWVCRLEYVELEGCVAENRNALDALDSLERLRENWITERIRSGRPVPAPRPALRS